MLTNRLITVGAGEGSRRLVALAVALAVIASVMAIATVVAVGAPGDLVVVSSKGDGGLSFPPSYAYQSSISADGRYVAFISTSTNLVTDVVTNFANAYRKDLLTGEILRCSSTDTGFPAIGNSYLASISDDGRYVAFSSDATNLPLGPNGFTHVYRKDLAEGQRGHLDVCSTNTTGELGNGDSDQPVISGDGRYVAFSSSAPNFAGVSSQQMYSKDVAGGAISLCSSSATSIAATDTSANASISADGRYVAFASAASNLIPGVSGGQVYLKDVSNEQIMLCSSDESGAQGDAESVWPSVSADGHFVAFQSGATNFSSMVGWQIYRKDLTTGSIVPCSTDISGASLSTGCFTPSISGNGRYVAFFSYYKDDPTTIFQVFRKDLLTGSAPICSSTSSPSYASQIRGNDNSGFPPDISADGKYVSFFSLSTNFPAGTTVPQIYRKEVSPGPSVWYFAEGYTGRNFAEYLCLANTSGTPATANVTYMFTDGTTQDASYTVPADSRYTVYVNSEVGFDREVSIRVLSESVDLVAERPMYFNYREQWTGGSDALGARAPATRWFFAEGTTLAGFDEYITVLNPGAAAANLTFHYMVEGQGEQQATGSVGAHSRGTFNARDQIGDSKNASLLLSSNQPVVAERPMYFNYHGQWTGGHDVVGANAPNNQWYLAEGTTRGGFEEWLCLQNPGDTQIAINARYLLGAGQGDPVTRSYQVPAKQRLTVSVNSEIGAEKDASIQLTSSDTFIAERPIYFAYQNKWTGGHDVLGANSATTTWFFAEGTTRDNFNEWLCLQNPGDTDAHVTIKYYTSTGEAIDKPWIVPANSRLTVNVNENAGANLDISARVTSDQPVIVERPMYFDYNGWTGGHDVVGYPQ